MKYIQRYLQLKYWNYHNALKKKQPNEQTNKKNNSKRFALEREKSVFIVHN